MNRQYAYPTAFKSWGPEEQDAIMRVVRSGYFTMGGEVEAFEEEFAQWHNRQYAIMVNSGSSANLVAVSALLISRYIGSQVRVPAIAWSTTYAPFVQNSIGLILVDVDETWNAIQSPITFVRCPVLGNPANQMNCILEDCCEGLGARTGENHLCGTFGTLSTFSFFHSHQISAIEGGMILTDDKELAELCKILRAHGWTRDVEYPQSFEEEYNFTHFGYNVRPLEMHAAIAREQLKKLQGFVDRRCENLLYFTHLIYKTTIIPIQLQTMVGKPSPFGIAFTCESKEARAKLVTALRANDIDCRLPTGGSFTKHPYGKPWAYDNSTPNADRIHDTGLFLGNAPFNIFPLIEKAVGVIKETL